MHYFHSSYALVFRRNFFIMQIHFNYANKSSGKFISRKNRVKALYKVD